MHDLAVQSCSFPGVCVCVCVCVCFVCACVRACVRACMIETEKERCVHERQRKKEERDPEL